MVWRVKFDVHGGHVHCNLFAAKQLNMTFAKCGDFTVRRGEEFASLLRAFAGAQFIGINENVGTADAIRED